LELATLINQYTGNKTPLDLRPARDWDRSGKRFASTEKARTTLGFESKFSIEEGLKLTVEWTKNNAVIIQSNILRHSKLMSQLEL
jgi:nucleoside-diphosphate-sugar epimerase